MLAACLGQTRLLVARGRLPQAAACYHASLSVRGRQSFQKPHEAITAAFSVRQELQWGCRGIATGTQPTERFENVIVPLLRAFFTCEGHCEVPDDYKVTAEHLAAADLSSSDCKIGFRLGRSLLSIETKGAYDIEARTDRQALLDAIDCDWAGERRFERIVMALQWFKASEGHMEVPKELVLDETQCTEAGMPTHIKEFRLGQTVNNICGSGHFVHVAARRTQLDNIGFIWDHNQHQFDHHVLPALQWFKATEGHMEVPKELVLDEAQCGEAGLPEHVKEFRLGQTVRDIRSKGIFVHIAARRTQLDSIGFIWDHDQHRFDHHVLPALHWFKASEGHMEVPQELVLDEAQCRKAGLPEHVTEFRLGRTVHMIRSRGIFVQTEIPSRQAQYTANKETLESTNFIWDASQHRFDCYIKPAVSWFKALEGHAKVPAKLVLDEMQCRNAGLPEHVKEFRLGQTVTSIRRQGVFVQTKDVNRQAQYAANKDWLGAHLDQAWLWAKLP